jgi:RimJ/RimL family protein N-acetyltransferase
MAASFSSSSVSPDVWSTARLDVAPLARSDAEELFAALAKPEVGAYLGGPDIESLPWLQQRIARILDGPPPDARAVGWLNFVMRLRAPDHLVVGRLEATLYADWAEVAWVLDPQFWRLGLGTEGATWLVQHLHAAHGIDDLWATADPRNEASLRIMRGLGFVDQAVPARRMPESYEDGDVVLARGALTRVASTTPGTERSG